jgi:hypothetical protein
MGAAIPALPWRFEASPGVIPEVPGHVPQFLRELGVAKDDDVFV